MNPQPFALSHRELDAGTVLVTLEGELGLASAPGFRRTLLELRRTGYSRFILDYSAVTFFDSTALGVLVVFNRDLPATGLLALADVPPSVARVLDVTGLDRVFALFSTVEAARRRFQEATPPPAEDTMVGKRNSPEPEGLPSPDVGTAAPPGEPEVVRVPLTEDAAVVLGIAATAIPFALSLDAQAERWLRALSRSGDAGLALRALGAHDDPRATTADTPEADAMAGWAVNADVVATVARHAGELAEHHDHRGIQTDDLLGAVADLYGPVFDRVLARHGVGREELLAALRPDRSG